MSEAPFTRLELSKMIDHSLLKPTLTKQDMIDGLTVAIREQVASATIKPCYTEFAAKFLEGSGVMINPVICFPMGYATTETKVAATHQAINQGADEIDMVLNLGALFSGEYQYVQDDIARVVEAAQVHTVKVILETGYYEDLSLIARACHIVEAAGGNFVKTSTGFAPSPYRNEYGETVGYTM